MKTWISLKLGIQSDQRAIQAIECCYHIRKDYDVQNWPISSIQQQLKCLDSLECLLQHGKAYYQVINSQIVNSFLQYNKALAVRVVQLLTTISQQITCYSNVWCMFNIAMQVPKQHCHLLLFSNLIAEDPRLLAAHRDYLVSFIRSLGSDERFDGIWLIRMMSKWLDFYDDSLTRLLASKAVEFAFAELNGPNEVFSEFFEQFEWVFVYLCVGVNQEFCQLDNLTLQVLDARMNERKHALFAEFMYNKRSEWVEYIRCGDPCNEARIAQFCQCGFTDSFADPRR